jgi:hypothetical protein
MLKQRLAHCNSYDNKTKERRVNLLEGVSISFRTGRLERELQMVQLSATRCSSIAIVGVSLVSFASIIFCVASQRVSIHSVRKLLDTPSYLFI